MSKGDYNEISADEFVSIVRRVLSYSPKKSRAGDLLLAELNLEEEIRLLLLDGPMTTMAIWHDFRSIKIAISFGALKKILKKMVKAGTLKSSRFRGAGGKHGVEYILAAINPLGQKA